MKHQIRIRRVDGIRQHYWKNYGLRLSDLLDQQSAKYKLGVATKKELNRLRKKNRELAEKYMSHQTPTDYGRLFVTDDLLEQEKQKRRELKYSLIRGQRDPNRESILVTHTKWGDELGDSTGIYQINKDPIHIPGNKLKIISKVLAAKDFRIEHQHTSPTETTQYWFKQKQKYFDPQSIIRGNENEKA